MTKPHAPSTDAERTAFAAADWVIRLDRGLTPHEQDEFFQWLATDPKHGEWFACRQRTWKEFDVLTQWRPQHSAVPNPDLLARWPRRRILFFPLVLAAVAASVALALTAWRPGRQTPPAQPASLAVAPDYESRVLDDGSIVELNRGAVIEVQFTPGERRVRLVQGEAHFKVAKNPQRPFVVQADGVNVRAVGTAFAVNLGAESVDVLVTEGRVRLDPPLHTEGISADAESTPADSVPAAPELVAGQRAAISRAGRAKAPRIVEVSPEEIARQLAWQPKLLDFSSTPLAAVVAEFNRYNRVQLILADPVLGMVPIVASYRSDNVDGFVRLLELTIGVRASRRGDTITLRRAR